MLCQAVFSSKRSLCKAKHGTLLQVTTKDNVKAVNTRFEENPHSSITSAASALNIIIIDKSLGTVGRLMLQGHSRRPK